MISQNNHHKQSSTDFLGNSCSETFWKVLRKSPMLESFCSKVAELKPPNL